MIQFGNGLINAGKRELEAQSVSARAVQLNPYDGYGWLNLGTSVYLQHKFPEAVTTLQQGLPYLPHSYNALRLMAFSNYNMQKYGPASTEFEKYLEMQPFPQVSPELIFTYAGLASLRAGDLSDSVYDLMQATPLSDKKADVLRARILAAVLGSRLDGAVYCTRLFRFFNPGTELNPMEILVNTIKRGQVSQTISYLETILPESTNDVSVIKTLAAAYVNTGQREKANTIIADAVTRHPESATLRLVYGDILYSEKRFPEAVVQYDEHLRLQPDSPLRADLEQKKAEISAGMRTAGK